MPLPTLEALEKDLREIGRQGFLPAMAQPLAGFSAIPSVRRAAGGGIAQRNEEIKALLSSSLKDLDEELADAGEKYLLSRASHKTRLKAAAGALSIEVKTFEGVRRKKLRPRLARALLSLAELDSQKDESATDHSEQLEKEPPHGELFAACPKGEAAKDRELKDVAARGAKMWWPTPSSGRFGSYFAFWNKVGTFPCEKVRFVVDQGSYAAQQFGQKPALNGEKDKLTIVSTSWFSTSASTYEIYCGVTNYGFAFEWAKDHADTLLNNPPWPSVFGATDRPAYPGIAGVHTLVQTSDDYLLFALRNDTTVTYHELTWSASFEQAILSATDSQKGDETVRSTIVRGLRTEWGIPASAVAASTTLAVGREYVQVDPTRLDLSSSILTAIRLAVDLKTVWKYLDRRPKIPDIDEHSAWAAVRFASRADLLQLLRFGRDRTDGHDLFHEFERSYPSAGKTEFYPGGPDTGIKDRGLMPTSAARLYLGSQWLA